MARSPAHSLLFACAVSAALAALTGPASAQQMTWYALDTSEPGTPAQVVFDAKGSSDQDSFFDVYIHGFWFETRRNPAGAPLTRMVFPGLSLFSQPGQPYLPAVLAQIAFPPGAAAASLVSTEVISHTLTTTPNPCWPTPIVERDSAGIPEQYVTPDPLIYQTKTAWPPAPVDLRLPPTRKGEVPGATFQLYPVHWTPSTRALDVTTHARYRISHVTNGGAPQAITKDAFGVASQMFLNWLNIATYYPPNAKMWLGDYLVVTPLLYGHDLLPLINQKAARGYAVTVHILTAAEAGNAALIRTAIENWYASTDPLHDHYALLVGDVNAIPMGTISGTPTDDLYADADANGTDDLDAEVYVGRLSVNNAADLDNQVGKILQYEDHPQLGFDYASDLLIANLQDAPAKYQGCLESVAGYGAYVVTPTFTKLYGSVAGNTNATISTDVNKGFGIVTYRGHGDWDEWWNWDTTGQSYFSTDVDALANPVASVVWSIACNTYELNREDCFGEHWMTRPAPGGAVSFYGASEPSDTDPNHVLTRALHRAVFQHGFTKQSRAIAFAEHTMMDTTASWNSWRYGLLGDPDMNIRRGIVYKVKVIKPAWILPNAVASVAFQVLDANDIPIPNALVGAYKPGAPLVAPATGAREALPLSATGALVAEFQDNQYTDAGGNVTLGGGVPTSGWLYYAVRLDEGAGLGEALLDSIAVGSPAGVPFGGLGPGNFGAFPNVTHAGTEFLIGRADAPAGTIRVCDVQGRVVRTLAVTQGAKSVHWDGATATGGRAASGVYFARYLPAGAAGGAAAVARLAIVN